MDAKNIKMIIELIFYIVVLCFGSFIWVLIYRYIKRRARLRKDQILERWEVLIEKGSGRGRDVYKAIESALASSIPPGVTCGYKEIKAGNLLYIKSYEGLVVKNSNLENCNIYIFAYDYGTSLHVAWFFTMQLRWFKRAIVKSLLKESDPRALIKYLDIPQELELSAYVSTIHNATKKATQYVMGKLEQDFSKINTKTKGFLEVW